MPKPRPRILCSPRFKKPASDNQTNPQSLSIEVPKEMSDEPDCEIVKVKNEEDEESAENESSKLCRDSITIDMDNDQPKQGISTVQFVKQCPMRLQEQFVVPSNQTIVTPISPSFALQFVPDTSPGSATHARNIYSNQSVVMVLPVNTVSAKVFNSPTLCTLQRIEQVSATQKIDRGSLNSENDFLETRKKALQKSFMYNSTVGNTDESNARCLIPWIKEERLGNKIPLKKPSRFVPLLPKPIRVETSSSIVPSSDNVKSVPERLNCTVSLTESNSILNDPTSKNLSSGNKRKRISVSNESDQSNSENLLNKSANKVQSVDKKNITDNVGSSDEGEGSIPVSQESPEIVRGLVNTKQQIFESQESSENINSSENRTQRISESRESAESVDSLKNKKRLISLQRELRVEITSLNATDDSILSSGLKETTDNKNPLETSKSNSPTLLPLQIPELSSAKDNFSTKSPESFVEEFPPVENTMDISSCESVDNDSCRTQCFVCKEEFSDRAKLHKHLTLAHPDVQFVFCNYYRSDSELQEHGSICRQEAISRDDQSFETIPSDEENDILPSMEKIQQVFRGKQKSTTQDKKFINECRDLSESSPEIPRTQKKPKRGRPRKTNNQTKTAPRIYVDENVVRHSSAAATIENLKTAETKKLIVSLTRLEDLELDKYLEKLATQPVTSFGDKSTNNSANSGIKKGNLPSQGKYVRKRARRRKGRPWTRKGHGKIVKQLGNNRQAAMNKQSSIDRGSETDRTICSDISSKSTKLCDRTNRRRIYSSSDESIRSFNLAVECILETDLDETNDEQVLEIITLPDSSDLADCDLTANEQITKRKFETRLSSSSDVEIETNRFKRENESSENFNNIHNLTPKTYLPRKRNLETATKLTQEWKSAKSKNFEAKNNNELCSNCKELILVMKRVTAQLEGNNVEKTSVQCPFCDVDFIAMIYLEEHVKGSHLYCKNEETPCKRSKSFADAKLDCDVEADLNFACQYCTERFSGEKDLNDHEFTDHNPSTSLKEISTFGNTPNYLKDVSSLCFQIENREENKIDASLTNTPKHRNAAENFSSPTTIRRILQTCVSQTRNEEKQIDSSRNHSFFECWFCNSTFKKRSEYICHVREVHDKLKAAPVEKKSTRSSSNSESFVLEMDASSNEEIVSLTKSLNASEQVKTDRDYLLKQLLSDDSVDGFDEVEAENVDNTAKEIIVEEEVCGSAGKKVIGLFAGHRCKICSKQFNRTQDLLMHGLSHKNERPKTEEKLSISAAEVSQELFVDPARNVQANEIESAASPNEPKSKINEDEIFGDYSEKSSIKSRSEIPIANTPKVSQIRNELRNKAFEEVLETEKGLANADETNANDKIPIECEKCNRKFRNQALLNEHLFFLHDDTLKDTVLTDILATKETKNRRWSCTACRQNFKLLQGFSRHRYIIHGDESMVHVCENCCKILTTVTMVNVHICTDVASYNCRTCEQSFPTGMSLRLHNSEKHMEIDEPNVCEPCNKSFLTKSMLKRHENSSHRFLRPYRPRKRSPVMMATQNNFDRSDEESFERKIDDESDNYSFRCSDENENFNFESQPREIQNKKKRMIHPMAIKRNCSGELKRRNRSRARRSTENSNDTDETNFKVYRKRARIEKSNKTTQYIKENDIHQCSLCPLYCLTKEVLEHHKAKVHSEILKVCQLCRKSYADGRLTRHMIDEHISPCETFTEKKDSSIWNFRNNIKANDTEAFVKILGMKRFMSLWEYHRYIEPKEETSSFNCSACDKNFPSNSMNRFHFFAHHDCLCVLCNIEFKSGKDAAKHKTDEHRSAESYMWFVHRTLKEIIATENFQKIVEQCFLEMISCDSAEEFESNDVEFDDLPSDSEKENPTGKTAETFFADDEYTEETDLDYENSRLPVEFEIKQEEENAGEEKLIVVVTEEDLDKYNIGTQHPNIWGLASHISSSYEDITPKDVKEMLETYLGN